MENKPESIVQSECLLLLQLYGVYHWRQNTGAFKVDGRYIRSGVKGIADILGILPNGQFLAVECKRSKGGILSAEQKEFGRRITENNGVYLVVNDSRLLEDFLKKTVKK